MLGFESDVIPRMVFEMKKRIPFVNVPLLDAIYDDLKASLVVAFLLIYYCSFFSP